MRQRWTVVAILGAWCLACGGGTEVPSAKLVSLEAGDIACYVTLDSDGEELSFDGDFELCPGGGSDASGLVGQQVTYELETANVQAGSCEGDPECTDTEEVPLVVAIHASGG